jgi:hypothetical protein
VEILLWLVPSLVATVAAMAWVSWRGREGLGELDADEVAERVGRALARDHVRRYAAAPPPPRVGPPTVTVREAPAPTGAPLAQPAVEHPAQPAVEHPAEPTTEPAIAPPDDHDSVPAEDPETTRRAS